KVDFLDVGQTFPGVAISTDLKNYVTAGNLNYRLQSGANWLEPTVGVIVTVTRWDDPFTPFDGHVVRVQGGFRAGTTYGGIEPSLAFLVYSDVVIDGLTLAGVPVAPTDEGKPFVQLLPKVSFNLGPGLSSYVEGELRHGDHLTGGGAKI